VNRKLSKAGIAETEAIEELIVKVQKNDHSNYLLASRYLNVANSLTAEIPRCRDAESREPRAEILKC